MNSIPVRLLTDDLMKQFFLAYWKECGSREEDFMIESYAKDALWSFRFGLSEKRATIDGVRWDIMTYELGMPTGVWPHVKVRYKIDDRLDGTPFEDLQFRFVVYANAIADKKAYPRVKAAVEDLVRKLKEKFPVIAEA